MERSWAPYLIFYFAPTAAFTFYGIVKKSGAPELKVFAQAGLSTLSYAITPSRCWRSSWPWWPCRAACCPGCPTCPTSPSSPTGASPASCQSTPWCGSGQPPTRWERSSFTKSQIFHQARNMLKRGPADNLSDAFMYIIPAISLVFAVVHTCYNCDKDNYFWITLVNLESRCIGCWCTRWQVKKKTSSQRYLAQHSWVFHHALAVWSFAQRNIDFIVIGLDVAIVIVTT